MTMLRGLSSKTGSHLVAGFMLERSSLQRSRKQYDLDLREMGVNSVTFVIITKDRPELMKHLIESILKTRLASLSIVLIDDSNNDNFSKNRRLLQSLRVPYRQSSTSQAGRLVEENLKKTSLATDEKNFIRECTGLSSPFCGYIERFLEQGRSEQGLGRCLQFAPYSPARNLGICSAVRFFSPDILVFLDDDCLILYPEKLRDQLQLVGSELSQKTIVAVAGLYKDLFGRLLCEAGSSKKILSILRGMDKFIKESFLVEKARFKIAPPHMLGGALILHKRAFSTIPFDPYVARGEDHSYALDLKRFLAEDELAVRDTHFVIGHQEGHLRSACAQKCPELNVLRDIFRFVYMRTKTGHSFIKVFLVRWALISLFSLLLNPSNYEQHKGELLALLFTAPKYAKENGSKFRRGIKAWNKFLCKAEM